MLPFATALGQAKTSSARGGGTQALIDKAPALKEAADRVVTKVVKSLQTMAGAVTTIEGMLAGLSVDQAKEVLASHGADGAAALLECPDLRFPMLLMLDSTLVHAIVELLCGGNGSEPQSPAIRPITPIDQQFSQILFTLAASAIQTEWSEFGFNGTRAAKIEGGLPADLLGPRGQDIGVVKITIGAFGVHGTMRLALPPGALDRFIGTGAIEAEGATAADPTWSGLLEKEIGQANVTLDAYLEAKSLPLSILASLKVGQILALPAEARDRVTLVSEDRVLYRGELGQADELYSLRIDEIVSESTKTSMTEPARRSPLFELSKA